MSEPLKANEGKELIVQLGEKKYARIPVKTHVLTGEDTLEEVLNTYVAPIVQQGDVIFLSEKAVSCTQKRAIPIKEIQPRWLARTLSKFVYKNPYGAGLGMPETMELTLQEAGTPRILLAGFVSVIGKLLGKRGWFYKVAGEKARSIDTPDEYTIPPYNEYIVLAPEDPEKNAKAAAKVVGVPVAIVDVNDLGQNIMGLSHDEISEEWLISLLQDNPLGQASQQTPIGIIREVFPEK